MIDDLKPYPQMKDSGVPWLGEVPEHWDVRRLRNLADMRVSNVDKHTKEDERPIRLCNYVDVYKNDYIRPSMNLMRATATREEIERFRLSEGDVLITKDSEAWNDIGVPALVRESADDLVSGYHLALLRPFRERIAGEFLFRSLQSIGLQYQFHVEANGVTRYGLSHAAIKSVWLPAPPISEQAAIVRFLDHVDRRIRRYIRAKQKLIKLLEELKAAIIHRAVTRGLDPNIRLKPSGVEWLGHVPEHWEVTRLKNVAAVQTGLTLGKDYRSAKTKRYPYLRVANVQTGRVDLRTVKEVEVPEAEARRSMLRAGDVLMTEGGDIDKLGRGCVWSGEIAECLHQNHVFAVRCGLRLLPAFLAGLMASNHGRAYFQTTAKQTTNLAATNSTTLRAFPLVLPDVAEQEHVLSWIATETEALVRAAADAEREIALLREYRTRLIADVVTGKLDVREAAARLPQEAEDIEPPDATDGEPDADESADDLDAEAEETAA
ncbi:MAG: restriction endonuclease subunit S [Chromatiaceae bacterium]|jgi:type I restriction enzyme S subunit|nr:restriction endonuclease subunit S [Chromatiaceae bacterium]